MLPLAADENLDDAIFHGLLRQLPGLDLVRVQDTELAGAIDPVLLEWAASEGRILLTHDVKTMSTYAYERVAADQPMPGVVVINRSVPVRRAIEEIALIAVASDPEEWRNQVRWLPL
ncbi:MAG TPA: DUF5615 family PIN-like protein [Chloroflexota bacterium]|jgi:hypothetical protein|nr:DUF5615 family PIN-like protein [Chloroflexota bacterium]